MGHVRGRHLESVTASPSLRVRHFEAVTDVADGVAGEVDVVPAVAAGLAPKFSPTWICELWPVLIRSMVDGELFDGVAVAHAKVRSATAARVVRRRRDFVAFK